jgi:hypothetical protein
VLTSVLLAAWQLIGRRLSSARSDRGDVPGWVLITLMTAGIVTALWLVAEPRLSGILDSALSIAGDPNS